MSDHPAVGAIESAQSKFIPIFAPGGGTAGKRRDDPFLILWVDEVRPAGIQLIPVRTKESRELLVYERVFHAGRRGPKVCRRVVGDLPEPRLPVTVNPKLPIAPDQAGKCDVCSRN